jgi:dTDP-4-dehydrorhamnose reductase
MFSRNRYLIIGGDGLIGSALVNFLKNVGEAVISTTRQKPTNDYSIYLDLADEVGKWEVLKYIGSFDAIIFCAGITELNNCEKNKILTRKVNVENVIKLASILERNCKHFVYLSSNAVFDGSNKYPSHNDIQSPINEYGRQKAEVENLLLKLYPSSITILRLTKVLGSQNPLFENWSHALKKGDKIQPFSDMYIAPIPLFFVLSVIRNIIHRNLLGILHLSGDQDVSYADIAFKAVRLLGANKKQVIPILARESNLFESVNRISTRTALDISRLKCELGLMPPSSIWTIEQFFLNPKILDGFQN